MARTKGAIAPRDDNFYMKLAVKEGYKAIENHAGKPFGAVVVKDGHVVGKGYDKTLLSPSVANHAIMIALDRTYKALCTNDLSGCIVYTTAEPCLMCYGACLNAHIDSIIYSTVESSMAGCNYSEQRTGAIKVNEYTLDNYDCKVLMADYLAKR